MLSTVIQYNAKNRLSEQLLYSGKYLRGNTPFLYDQKERGSLMLNNTIGQSGTSRLEIKYDAWDRPAAVTKYGTDGKWGESIDFNYSKNKLSASAKPPSGTILRVHASEPNRNLLKAEEKGRGGTWIREWGDYDDPKCNFSPAGILIDKAYHPKINPQWTKESSLSDENAPREQIWKYSDILDGYPIKNRAYHLQTNALTEVSSYRYISLISNHI